MMERIDSFPLFPLLVALFISRYVLYPYLLASKGEEFTPNTGTRLKEIHERHEQQFVR
jgi:hypothetical protein